jgi:uncharacterized protein (DUF1499 family)
MAATDHHRRRRILMRRLAIASAVVLAAGALLVSGCESAARGVDPATGSLAPCPSAPHCVCSEDPDPGHRIAPLAYSGAKDDAHRRLLAVLHALPRCAVVEDDGTYLHATVTSAVMRFTDDLEFRFDDERKLIQVRSTSRVGYSDLGVNRARVEDLRTRFAASGQPD